MKKQTKQKSKIKALLAAGLIAVAALFAGCKNDTTNVVAETHMPFGSDVGTTKFYKSSLANAGKANDIHDMIENRYNYGWNSTEKGKFTTRVTEIYKGRPWDNSKWNHSKYWL